MVYDLLVVKEILYFIVRCQIVNMRLKLLVDKRNYFPANLFENYVNQNQRNSNDVFSKLIVETKILF